MGDLSGFVCVYVSVLYLSVCAGVEAFDFVRKLLVIYLISVHSCQFHTGNSEH